jgi:hypothetical protein
MQGKTKDSEQNRLIDYNEGDVLHLDQTERDPAFVGDKIRVIERDYDSFGNIKNALFVDGDVYGFGVRETGVSYIDGNRKGQSVGYDVRWVGRLVLAEEMPADWAGASVSEIIEWTFICEIEGVDYSETDGNGYLELDLYDEYELGSFRVVFLVD